MTRHGWYEWRPDTRDERDRDQGWEFFPGSTSVTAAAWCFTCGRYVGVEGCPACGEPNA